MSDKNDRSASGTYCWDHEDCPRDGCEGPLQQQDRYNVMCLSCGEDWAHYKDGDDHMLVTRDGETIARKARMVPDGGTGGAPADEC